MSDALTPVVGGTFVEVWAMVATRNALLIAGPTASGKSALAMQLAQAFGGEIINTDSMQVYRGLRILTARPTPAEEALVPHRLYGVAGPDEPWSVGRWLEAAKQQMNAVHAAGHLAIFVGGTGLYFSALEDGLHEIPEVDTKIRERLARRFDEEGLASLRKNLEACDPDLARQVKPGDRQRTLRGLEVFEATGRPLSHWRQDTVSPPLLEGATVARVLLMPARAALYAHCDARFDAMLNDGLLDEIGVLRARNLNPGFPAMKALGVPQLICHLDGGCTLEDAVESAKMETRRYAKRQMTWFRNRMSHWPSYETIDSGQVAGRVEDALGATGKHSRLTGSGLRV